jgi:hypothetical protein
MSTSPEPRTVTLRGFDAAPDVARLAAAVADRAGEMVVDRAGVARDVPGAGEVCGSDCLVHPAASRASRAVAVATVRPRTPAR